MDKEINQEQNKQDQDAIQAAGEAAQVAGKNNKADRSKKNKKKPLWFWIVAAIAVIAVLLASRHKPDEDSQNSPGTQTIHYNDYRNSLNIALEQLASKKHGTPQAVKISINNPADQNSPSGALYTKPKLPQEYLARQNAPTSAYDAPDNDNLANPQANNSGVQEAVFAGQGKDVDFGNQNTSAVSIDAKKIPHPAFTIAAGEFMHAVLETAVNSDLPGMVRAVIADPVYAYIGERVLIPAGSRLIGQYSAGIVQGQSRVMVVWNRVILPNGITAEINSPNSDALGRGGQGADSIDTHFWQRFGEASLLSVIGAGTATYGVDPDDAYNSAAIYRAAIAQSFQEAANQSLQSTVAIKPTIHIHQGAKINVFVARDLSFYNVLTQENKGNQNG